ncbi:MAG: hypothetical protein RL194_201, partial [Pseudomonadota bacterium]
LSLAVLSVLSALKCLASTGSEIGQFRGNDY